MQNKDDKINAFVTLRWQACNMHESANLDQTSQYSDKLNYV